MKFIKWRFYVSFLSPRKQGWPYIWGSYLLATERELLIFHSVPHFLDWRDFPNGQLQNHAVSSHKSAFNPINMNFSPHITASKPLHLAVSMVPTASKMSDDQPSMMLTDIYLFPSNPPLHFLTNSPQQGSSSSISLLFPFSCLSTLIFAHFKEWSTSVACQENAHYLISFLQENGSSRVSVGGHSLNGLSCEWVLWWLD